MGKLRVLSGRQVCAILELHGFSEVRRRGSHVLMQTRRADMTLTVPVPDHSELRIDSDVDLLVRFAPDAEWSLLDHARLEQELEEILGRRVDLVTRAAIEESPNWVVRKAIHRSSRPYLERISG